MGVAELNTGLKIHPTSALSTFVHAAAHAAAWILCYCYSLSCVGVVIMLYSPPFPYLPARTPMYRISRYA